MKFEKTDVWGFEHAIRGMRNTLESWHKSDSYWGNNEYSLESYVLGENDISLMQKLIKAGTEHRKFMRQIFVSVDITAPLYWWKEIVNLPESWLQTRTITMNYENLINIIHHRKNHKLTEWSVDFMNWAKSLPYANELLFI